MKNKILAVSIGAIIILGFLVYANSLNGKFIWDDDALVVNNAYIKNWSMAPKIFAGGIGAGAARKFASYRPVQIFTYLMDYSLWGLNPRGYHLINTLLHILVALAIYWFINILYDDKLMALLTSALFVVHPIHAGAVSYISGRADMLAMLFTILCFISYVIYIRSSKLVLYVVALFSFVIALLSKENTLILPALLLLYHYIFKKRLRVAELAPILCITLVYILLRFTFLKALLPHADVSATLLQRIPGFFVAVTNYIRLLIFPYGLHMEYGKGIFSFADPRVILGVFVTSALLIYAFKMRRRNNLICFSISWFFIALIPVSNFYPLNSYMAEHWLYLPSLGFFLLAANILTYTYNRSGKSKDLFIILIVVLSAFYGNLTATQNKYWSCPKAFYERALKYAPDSSKLYNNLGMIYYLEGKFEKAAGLFERAIEKNEGNPNAYSNLGAVMGETGRNEEAMELYKKAIELDPKNASAYFNLAFEYNVTGRQGKAIDTYKKALEINPYFAKAYYNLAAICHENGQYASAIKYCDEAARLGYPVPAEFLKLLRPHRK